MFLGVAKQFDDQAVRFISVSIEAVFRIMSKCFDEVKLLWFALSVSISKVLRRSLFIHTAVLILEIKQAILKKSDTKLLQKKRIISDCWAPVAACDVVMSWQTKIMTPPYRGRLQSCERHRNLGPSLCFCSARLQRSKAQTCYNFINTLGTVWLCLLSRMYRLAWSTVNSILLHILVKGCLTLGL